MPVHDKAKSTLTGQFAQLCLWTGLSGFSLGLFLWQVFHPWYLQPLLLNNRVHPVIQREILIWIGGTVMLLGIVVATILALWRRKTIGPSRIPCQVLRTLRSGVVLFLLPALLMKITWARYPLTMMFVLGLMLLHLYVVSMRGPALIPAGMLSRGARIPRYLWYVSLGLMVVGYTGYFSHYTVLRHYQLESQTFDLGIFENVFFHALNGHLTMLGHFSPVLALWYPFYHLIPTPETLLVVQSAFIGLSAIPLFLFARLLLRSDLEALAITLCYLIHPGNHGPNFYDIHELASLPIFVLALFYFLEKRHHLGYFAALILSLTVKEDIGLLMLPIAAFIAVHKKRYKLALITAALGILWYVGAQEIRFLAGAGKESSRYYGHYYAQLQAQQESGALGVIKTLVTNPFYSLTTILTKEKILYMLQMCLPLLFLPVLRRRNLWLLAYGAGITLLATRPYLFRISFQYTWYTLPLLFVAAVYTLAKFKQSGSIGAPQDDNLSSGLVSHLGHRGYHALLPMMLLASFVLSWQYGAILYPKGFVGGFAVVDFTFDDGERERLRALRSLIRDIPQTASVAGSEKLIPHVQVEDRHSVFRARGDLDPDYLLIFQYELPRLEKKSAHYARDYTLMKETHGILLMKKRAGSRQ